MKTLYLLEMGMNDERITTDIKNHRVRVLENIDIIFENKKYNMFFEFTQGTHFNYRTTNKRTGEPLKKPVQEVIVKDGIFVDTQFERQEGTWKDGTPFFASYRKSLLEREIFNKHYDFSRKSVLEIINAYSIEKYDRVVLVEEQTKAIIEKIGGSKEKEIIKKRDFQKEGDFYFHVSKWDDNEKTVEVIRRVWEPTKDGRKLVKSESFQVDLINEKIMN